MTAKTELAVADKPTTTVAAYQATSARFTSEQIAAAPNVEEASQLPSLHGDDVTPLPVSLGIDYWSPKDEGEQKMGWILGIAIMPVMQVDFTTGEPIGTQDMECVCFMEQLPNGTRVRIYTAAKMLVSYTRSAIARGEVIPGKALSPVMIRYLGKKTKNFRNISQWEIRPLVVAVQ